MNPNIVSQIFVASGLLPAPETEYRFHATRRWRFDYAWVQQRVALEVEGGVWTGGRHTRGAGFLGDIEKYNAATMAGWRVIRCTPKTTTSMETIKMLAYLMSPDAG